MCNNLLDCYNNVESLLREETKLSILEAVTKSPSFTFVYPEYSAFSSSVSFKLSFRKENRKVPIQSIREELLQSGLQNT